MVGVDTIGLRWQKERKLHSVSELMCVDAGVDVDVGVDLDGWGICCGSAWLFSSSRAGYMYNSLHVACGNGFRANSQVVYVC
jgi:hypothetical protein